MKKYLIVLILLLTPALCFGWGVTSTLCGTSPAGVPGVACTGTGDACTGNDNGSYAVGFNASMKWTGTLFVADATATLCSLTLQMSEEGTYAGAITACVFSDDASAAPASSLGCATGTAVAADIPATVGDVTFTGLSVDVTSGTTYHVVIWSSTSDETNYVKWYYEDSDCVGDGEEITRSEDGITWATRSGAYAMEFTSKKLE